MYRTSDRAKFVGLAVLAPVMFVIVLAAFALQPVEERKAVKKLVAKSGARQLDTEVRIGRFEYTKPSITFYVGRRVEHLMTPEAAAEFLTFLVPSYLFLTEKDWREKVLPLLPDKTAVVVAKQYDYDRQPRHRGRGEQATLNLTLPFADRCDRCQLLTLTGKDGS